MGYGGFVSGNPTGRSGKWNTFDFFRGLPLEPVSATGGTDSLDGEYLVHTFSYTGSDQTFSVTSPGEVEVFVWGAGGGGSNAEGYPHPGGCGGYATGSFFANVGDYVIQVGGGGLQTTGSNTRPSRAYPNGGLPSRRSGYIAGGGGGRSGIFSSSVSASNALVIAGAGGGAGAHGNGSNNANVGCHGGNGGGDEGTGGYSAGQVGINQIQNGGTQSAGGITQTQNGGSSNGGSGQLRGADAGLDAVWNNFGGWNSPGGGGDGWYGGGTQEAHVGGGGGSGYLDSAVTGFFYFTSTDGTRQVNGISPPETSNSYYQSGIGQGNVNAPGGNGLVIIRYLLSP